MASRHASLTGGVAAHHAHVVFSLGNRQYLLTEPIKLSPKVSWHRLDGVPSVMQRAMKDNLALERALKRSFGIYRSVNHATEWELPNAIADLVHRRCLQIFDLGPPVVAVQVVSQAPSKPPTVDRSMIDKVRIVIIGLKDVPLREVGADGVAAFQQLKSQMLTSQALTTMMIFVFAGWVAAQATGVGGVVLDAAIMGAAVYFLGMQAFDWIHRLGSLVGDIAYAKSDDDLRRCSSELANLIVQIGVVAFITLLTRAAAKYVSKSAAGEPEPRSSPIEKPPPIPSAKSTVGSPATSATAAGSAATAPSSEIAVGTKVTRNFGGASGPYGESWTTDPITSQSRNSLGLETTNSGEFVAHGVVVDNSGITTRTALPWGRFAGGGQETLIPDAANKVRLTSITMPDEPLPFDLESDPLSLPPDPGKP